MESFTWCTSEEENFASVEPLKQNGLDKNGYMVEECLMQKTKRFVFFFKDVWQAVRKSLFHLHLYSQGTSFVKFQFPNSKQYNKHTFPLLYRTESNKQKPHVYTTRIVFELEDRKKKKKKSFQGDRRGGEVGSPAETKEGCVGVREVNREREGGQNRQKDRERGSLLWRECKEDLKLNSGYEGGGDQTEKYNPHAC